MKTTKYTGIFRADNGHTYTLSVSGFGFLQAFFLLTADAIRTGQHYQLHSIEDDKGNVRFIDDIMKVSSVFL